MLGIYQRPTHNYTNIILYAYAYMYTLFALRVLSVKIIRYR